ncbi:MAG: hypothetical protein MI784_02025, partial [Cytophagales bacterium]|nr:hypothetical protein [Cytophagales bacterium]
MRNKFLFFPPELLKSLVNNSLLLERSQKLMPLETSEQKREKMLEDCLALLRNMLYGLQLFEIDNEDNLERENRIALDSLYWWIQQQTSHILASLKASSHSEHPQALVSGERTAQQVFWEDMKRLEELAGFDVFSDFLEQHHKKYKKKCVVECLTLTSGEEAPAPRISDEGVKLYYPSHCGRDLPPVKRIGKDSEPVLVSVPYFVFWYKELIEQCYFYEPESRHLSLLSRYLQEEYALMEPQDFLMLFTSRAFRGYYGWFDEDLSGELVESSYRKEVEKYAEGLNRREEDREDLFLKNLGVGIHSLAFHGKSDAQRLRIYSLRGESNNKFWVFLNQDLFDKLAPWKTDLGSKIAHIAGRNVRMNPPFVLESKKLADRLEEVVKHFIHHWYGGRVPDLAEILIRKEMEKRKKPLHQVPEDVNFLKQERFQKFIREVKSSQNIIVIEEAVASPLYRGTGTVVEDYVFSEALGELMLLLKLVGDSSLYHLQLNKFTSSRVDMAVIGQGTSLL